MTLIKRLQDNKHSEFHCDYCNTQVTKVHGAGLRAPSCGDISCIRKIKVQKANEKYPTSPMTKIQDLGIIETKPQRFEHMAIYECPVCSDHTTIRFSEGTTQKTCGKLGCRAQKTVRKRTHKTIHGKSNTKLYHVWKAMVQRCKPENADKKAYKSYAGKGITVCDKWQTFEGFYEDMGKTYEEFIVVDDSRSAVPSIDRIDADGNYELNNCQWLSQGDNSGKDRKVPVTQLTLDGRIVAEYTDAYDAAEKAIGSKGQKVIAGKINAVCIGKRASHAGCVWVRSSEVDDTFMVSVGMWPEPIAEEVQESIPTKVGRPVVQINPETGDVIAEYPSHYAAGEAIGLNSSNYYKIKSVCEGKRNTTAKFGWKYKDELVVRTSDGSPEFVLWNSDVKNDCSAKWKDYENFLADIGCISGKLVKENGNKPWSKSNCKDVAVDYVKADVSSRKVLQLTNDETEEIVATFDSSIDAAKTTGVQNANIRGACIGNKRKSAGGFKWRYSE